MGIRIPNIDGGSPGAKWVLKAHTSWKAEYEASGAVDFSAIANYTDSEQNVWTILSVAPQTYALTSNGLYMESGAAGSCTAALLTRGVIPGLTKEDRLWMIFKIASVSLPNNNNESLIGHTRRPSGTDQYGVWRLLDGGANLLMNPTCKTSDHAGGTTQGTEANIVLSFPDSYFSINTAGLRYEYRRNAAGAGFPSIPDPSEVSLFTTANFDGAFSGTQLFDPPNEGIDLPNDRAVVRLLSNAAGNCELTFEEFWLYRYE